MAVVGLAACAGGGASLQQQFGCFPNDPNCGRLAPMVTLSPARGWQPPSTPIAIGSSADVSFVEEVCFEPAQRGGTPPAGHCDAPFAPKALSAVVQPKANTNAPCPMTVLQIAPGTLRFTRTGPGDPVIRSLSGANGFCDVQLSDLTAPGANYLIVTL